MTREFTPDPVLNADLNLDFVPETFEDKYEPIKTPVYVKKSNTPEKNLAQAIRERMRGKSIVFCLPGRGCSYIFLKSFASSFL